MGRIAGVPNRLTTEVKGLLQDIIDGVLCSIEVDELNTNQKIKLLQISLQYTLPRLKNIADDRSKEPTEIQVNIVETSDELDRLNKIVAYEKEHNVKIEGFPTIYLVKGEEVIEYDADPTEDTMTEFLHTTL